MQYNEMIARKLSVLIKNEGIYEAGFFRSWTNCIQSVKFFYYIIGVYKTSNMKVVRKRYLRNGILSLLCLFGLMYSQHVRAQYKNIIIVKGKKSVIGPCEPSIVISPKEPKKMVVAVVSAQKQKKETGSYTIINRIFYSFDYGKNWKSRRLHSRYGDFGDPCMVADDDGGFYYFHLSDPEKSGWSGKLVMDRIVCQQSGDGTIWTSGTGIGHDPPRQQDKPWAVFDSYSGRLFLSWTEFDKYGSDDPQDRSNILFSASLDRGKNWSQPVRINQYSGNCLDGNKTPQGAVPAVGPKGSVFVAWSYDEKIYFDRSLDGGLTWKKDDIVVADQPGGWAFNVPGFRRVSGQPVTACDLSYSPYAGSIYVCWSDQRKGERDTDIWLAVSRDGGDSWSEPLRVNDDETTLIGKHQFFSWMAVDQKTGNVYIVFYDRRNYKDLKTDVYMAISKDGGRTFENLKISDRPFVPDNKFFLGDYNNISAYNGIVRPVWTSVVDGQPAVMTAIIDFR